MDALAPDLVGAEKWMLRVELHDFRGGSEAALLRLLLTNGIALSPIHLPYEQVIVLIRRPDAHYVTDPLVGCLERSNQAGPVLSSMEHSLRRRTIHCEVVLLLFHMPLLNLRVVDIGIVFAELKMLY